MATRQMNVTVESAVTLLRIDPVAQAVSIEATARIQGAPDVGRGFSATFTSAELTAAQRQAVQTLIAAAQGWADQQLAGL